MKKIFVAMLFVSALYTPATAVNAAPTAPNDHASHIPSTPAIIDHRPLGWKSSERFEISNIDGFQEAYNSEEPIVLYVEGKSDKMSVEKENGFYVAATLKNLSENFGDIITVEYDTGRRAWLVKFIAPKDNTKQYKISVHLLCGGNDSPCATVYGEGSKIDKILPIKVR